VGLVPRVGAGAQRQGQALHEAAAAHVVEEVDAGDPGDPPRGRRQEEGLRAAGSRSMSRGVRPAPGSGRRLGASPVVLTSRQASNLSSVAWTRETIDFLALVQPVQPVQAFSPTCRHARRCVSRGTGVRDGMLLLLLGGMLLLLLGWTGWTGWTNARKSTVSRVRPLQRRLDRSDGRRPRRQFPSSRCACPSLVPRRAAHAGTVKSHHLHAANFSNVTPPINAMITVAARSK
jgi:hypothetical protein